MRGVVRVVVACGVMVTPSLASAVPAAAGGGCHAVRERGQTEAAGRTVRLTANCMSPTVLRVEPGAAVTFVNDDPYAHNVFGTTWGVDHLGPGASHSQRFESAGTYAYTCSLHPGMVGAVVVGAGRGSGAVVDVGPVASTVATVAAESASVVGAQSAATAWPSSILAAAVAGVVGWLAGRRRSHRGEPAGATGSTG